MKSKLPVPTAKDINDAHRCARESAECAVEWAVKCGQMLKLKKDEVGHGNWESWVEKNCEFTSRSASAYMKVAAKQAQIGSALPISSIRQALEEDKKPKSNTPKGAVSVVKPKGTEETGTDRPAASTTPPARASQPPAAEIRAGERPADLVDDDAPERPSDEEFAAIDREIQESEARVLRADDVTAGYHDELKRQATELAAVKLSRDGYMDGKAAITKLLQAEQRKNAKLTKRIQELEKENKALRERLGITVAA